MNVYFNRLKEQHPLIHAITNYVTVNDVANMLLACGARPIMAEEEEEVEDITSLCEGLTLNIGTLSKVKIPSMLKAGKKANLLNHPVVLDPVGVGASTFRTEAAYELINNIQFSVIRGNISEIKTLVEGKGKTQGVDANELDEINEDTLDLNIERIKSFAGKMSCVIVVTGAIDLVADKERCYVIRNGRPEMRFITGTGCQLTSMITAFIAANKEHILEATAAATLMMGIAGERAYSELEKTDGNATYRNKIIDAVYHMTGEVLEREAKYEIR